MFQPFTTCTLLLFLLGITEQIVSAAPNSIFTEKENLWLQEHREITLVVNKNPPPISMWTDPARSKIAPPFPASQSISKPTYPHTHPAVPLLQVDKEKQVFFQGVAADYLHEVSIITGVNFVVTHIADNNFTAISQALKQGAIGMMPSIMLGQHSLSSDLLLTEPYIEVPVVVVMQKDAPHLEDITQLNSMKVAGVISIQPKVEALGLTVKTVHFSPREGLMGVATGKFDAFISGLPNVSNELSKNPITNVKIVGELPSPSQFTMAVSPHIHEFLPIFNKAMQAIPQEKRDEIWRKWFKITYEKKWISPKWLGIASIFITLVILGTLAGIIYYRHRLHKIHNAIESLDPHLLKVEIDNDITITEVTEALCVVTGFKAEHLLGRSLAVLGSPGKEDPSAFNHLFKLMKQGKTWKGEVRLRRKDGKTIWTDAVISPLRRKNETAGGYTIIFQDASKRKHFETLATRDELTGLYNRRHFNTCVPKLLKRASEQKQLFGLFLLDVDNFKKYNDNYGHPAGDEVLATLGKTLRDNFQRDQEMSFRLGGEEFGVVSILNTPEDAKDIAEKILLEIRGLALEHVHNDPGIITVSIGIYLSSSGGDSDLKLIYQQADSALYQAKEGGRNKYVFI